MTSDEILRKGLGALYGIRGRINSEETFLRRTLLKRAGKGTIVLDVGCGHGRFYDIITSSGSEYVGVDSNPATVERNRAKGRNVLTVSDFEAMELKADLLLLSHIIEHFDCDSLIAFLNTYLRRLKIGGSIVILTPLYHRGFYDDFDHVKPYNPGALRQMFCHSSSQTRVIAIEGSYKEVGIWFKHDPVWHTHRTGKWSHCFAVPLTLASALSFGLLGKLMGYGMVLQRVS